VSLLVTVFKADNEDVRDTVDVLVDVFVCAILTVGIILLLGCDDTKEVFESFVVFVDVRDANDVNVLATPT
jgi:hypothetical protein